MKRIAPKYLLLLCSFFLITCHHEDVVSPFVGMDKAIRDAMIQYVIPGVAVAIVKNERLVYVKTFGYADKESGEKAINDNLFRIASVSKPVTAISTLKLVQDGSLDLDQTVFGPSGILGETYGKVPVGSTIDLITVRHLLNHVSGWTNEPVDPVFGGIYASQSDMITGMIATRPLAASPGATYYYLNFGYIVLGRVIEKITGMKYEDYVKSTILEPSGVSTMRIGGSSLGERFPDEVKYYQVEYDPYALNFAINDSAAGWIASVSDLARFITHIDGGTTHPDLLAPETLNLMYFGNTKWYHTGSMPGTSALLCKRDPTYSYVMLANTRKESSSVQIQEDFRTILDHQISIVSEWPSGDLF